MTNPQPRRLLAGKRAKIRAHAVERKTSLRSLGPRVSASRMVRDYVEEMYEPAAARADALGENGGARAKELAGWKQLVAKAWPSVRIPRRRSRSAISDRSSGPLRASICSIDRTAFDGCSPVTPSWRRRRCALAIRRSITSGTSHA